MYYRIVKENLSGDPKYNKKLDAVIYVVEYSKDRFYGGVPMFHIQQRTDHENLLVSNRFNDKFLSVISSIHSNNHKHIKREIVKYFKD